MSIDKKKIKKFIGISVAVLGTTFVGMSILARKKKLSSIYEDDKEQKNPFEGKKVVLIENEADKENADGVKGHLEATGDVEYNPSFYEKRVKRAIDVVLSFGALVVLSPVFVAIALAIKIEDPGPVLFIQKRVGQNKKYFKLHKFRSMKISTPHNIPTHQLENPEQYITKVGKFLRAHSLDELPQIWDIFIGNMSVIGPRPGLWNQDLLTAERDKYGANDVKPGLTGWAQINGRDELEIPDKAKLDGEYVKKMGVLMDIKCFMGSLHVFGKDESVIEGGTGEIKKNIDKGFLHDSIEGGDKNKSILIVANVGKEHIIKFHIPTIKSLKKHGWSVDVACAGEDVVPYCDNQIYGKWMRSPFTLKTFEGIRQLRKIINAEHYDIIYCHTPVGGLVARLAAKNARKDGTKVVYCAHGLHFYKGAPAVNWMLYYPIEKYLAKYTDSFFTVNKEDYCLVKKSFGKKLNVVYVPEVGVDFSRLKVENDKDVKKEYRNALGIADNTIVLIYVAELIENKNQKMLINALAVVAEKHENIHLILVGPDHNGGKYQNYAKIIGIADKVSFLGWRSDIGNLMHISDICVASSIREGFGINIVEAMYCGLPVIATNNRGHVTIINHGENGLLVNVNDYKTMAKYINLLIENPEIRNKYSNINVSQYDCDVIAEQLVWLIENQL